MEITPTSNITTMTSALGRGGPAGMSAQSLDTHGSRSGRIDSLQLSPMGRMGNQMPELNADQQTELRAFRDEMRTALRSGEFDAEAMASKAPDFMHEHAANNDTSLVDVFSQIGSRVESLQAQFQNFGQGNSMFAQNQNNLLDSLLARWDNDE